MMSMTSNIFQDVLTNGYEEMFDLYITDDQSTLSDTIYFKDTHPQLPLIRIIDPAKRVPVEEVKVIKSILNKEAVDKPETSKQAKGSYPFTQDVMFMPVHHDPSKFKEQIE